MNRIGKVSVTSKDFLRSTITFHKDSHRSGFFKCLNCDDDGCAYLLKCSRNYMYFCSECGSEMVLRVMKF